MLYLQKGIIGTYLIYCDAFCSMCPIYVLMFFYYSLNKDSRSGFWELKNNSKKKITSYFFVLDVLFLSSYSIGILTESVKSSHQLFLHRLHPYHKKIFTCSKKVQIYHNFVQITDQSIFSQ